MSRKRFLLDIAVMSDLVRTPWGRVAIKIREVGEEAIAVSVITAAELRYGCLKKGSKPFATQAHQILDRIEIVPIEEPCDQHYAQIRHSLQSTASILDGNDLIIASQAIATNRILVTPKVDGFAKVKGLKIENWLAHP